MQTFFLNEQMQVKNEWHSKLSHHTVTFKMLSLFSKKLRANILKVMMVPEWYAFNSTSEMWIDPDRCRSKLRASTWLLRIQRYYQERKSWMVQAGVSLVKHSDSQMSNRAATALGFGTLPSSATWHSLLPTCLWKKYTVYAALILPVWSYWWKVFIHLDINAHIVPDSILIKNYVCSQTTCIKNIILECSFWYFRVLLERPRIIIKYSMHREVPVEMDSFRWLV